MLEHPLEAERHRLAVDQREHVRAEAGLQLRVLEELLHHGVRAPVALHLDHDAHAGPVAFVANVADVGDAAVAHQVRHLLDERGLVDLVWQLGDHHRHAPRTNLLERDLPADDHAPATGGIHVPDRVLPLLFAGHGVLHVLEAEDRAAGGEVRAMNDLA